MDTIVDTRAKFINHSEIIVKCAIEDSSVEIKVGDVYVGKRNTGWELDIASEIVNGYIMSDYGPILDMIYPYDICECRKVKAIVFS